MVCRQCGTEIADKALICYRCGTATTEPLYKPAKPASGRSRKGLVLAVIIAMALLALLYLLFPGSLGLTSGGPDATFEIGPAYAAGPGVSPEEQGRLALGLRLSERPSFSSVRAPARMPVNEWFPSRHAYS